MDKKKYIGLMSGTSLDAVDVAILEFHPFAVIATHSEPIPTPLKAKLSLLSDALQQTNEIDLMGELDVLLGQLFAKAVNHCLKKNNYSASDITAIGSHGQTIRHRPDQNTPFTLQIGDPNTIAARTGITTVADFRRRDMALGGQAAPLAPLFHDYLLRHCIFDEKRSAKSDYWVLNIGGIANLTHLPQDQNKPILGFDTGPGNTLLDNWAMQHLGAPYDDKGAWAASGVPQSSLLNDLLSDPYFQRAPPKSTGREYFNEQWLQSYLRCHAQPFAAVDIQATLLELTTQSIRRAIRFSDNSHSVVLLCGGGAHNQNLTKRLQLECHPHPVTTIQEWTGLHPDWVEAACFAWLAKQTLEGKPGNCPKVTGARKPTILGAIYPA